MSHQPDIRHPESIKIVFSEGQFDKEISHNSAYQEDAFEQKYNRSKEIHYRDSPELGKQINRSKVVHKFLPKQSNLNKIFRLTEKKISKGSHLPKKIKEVEVGYFISPYFKKKHIFIFYIITYFLQRLP